MRQPAKAILREHGGQMRMSEAVSNGIPAICLYALRDRSIVEPVRRGTYRLTELPPLSNPDLGYGEPALSQRRRLLGLPRHYDTDAPRSVRGGTAEVAPPGRAHQFSTKLRSRHRNASDRWRRGQDPQPRRHGHRAGSTAVLPGRLQVRRRRAAWLTPGPAAWKG